MNSRIIALVLIAMFFSPTVSLAVDPASKFIEILKQKQKEAEERKKASEAEEEPAQQPPPPEEMPQPEERQAEAVPEKPKAEAPAPEKPQEAAPAAQPKVEGRGKVEKTVTQQGVSFYFDDADVYEVINTVFGEILKVNYIIDPKVSGRVNFRTTTPIPNNQILSIMEIILRINGIAIVEERGLYRIIPLPDISKEPAPVRFGKKPEGLVVKGISIVQIVPLDYIESAEMVKILTPLLTKGAVILDIPGKNYLMIADTDRNMSRLLQVVQIFDKEDVQEVTRPKVYVYPLQNSKANHVAEILQEIFLGGATILKSTKKDTTTKTTTTAPATQQKPGQPAVREEPKPPASLDEPLVTPGTKIFPDEITNSLIILTTPRDYAVIEDVIKRIDVVPRQVLIEVLVAEVSLTDSLKFGVEWFLKSHFTLDNTPLTGFNVFGEGIGSFDSASPFGPSGFTFAAIDSAGVVRGLLQSLAKDSLMKVLASPHIMASDNRAAKIQVGKQVPIQTSSSVTTGGETVYSVQYRDTGIVLSVKPQINEGGLVSLEISQEVSSVEPETGVQGNPIITNRNAETHVVVQDGQSIVIGGLIQENISSSRDGIPILMDIPVLGLLFGATKKSTDRTELIVTITPHVVKNIDEAKAVTDRFRKRLRGLDTITPGVEVEKTGTDEPQPDAGSAEGVSSGGNK